MSTRLKVSNILDCEGKTLGDIILSMQSDYTWVDVFDEVEKAYETEIESYSYEKLTE